MILTILRILFLRLRNNPLELLLVFVMPVIFFSIFAAIFSNGIATGSDKKVRVGWISSRDTALGFQLRGFLERNSSLQCSTLHAGNLAISEDVDSMQEDKPEEDNILDDATMASRISEAQKSGRYDLIIKLPADFPNDLAHLTDDENQSACKVSLITDGQNPMAVSMVTSIVSGFFAQKKATAAAGQLMSLGTAGGDGERVNGFRGRGIGGEQSMSGARDQNRGDRFFDALREPTDIFKDDENHHWLRTDSDGVTSVHRISVVPSRWTIVPMQQEANSARSLETVLAEQPLSDVDDALSITVENPQAATQENPRIAMYAAGIAVLFLLFSATGNAAALLEEAESGTLDRILVSQAGLFHIVSGKWLGILLLGCLQITVMFLWAEAVFKIQLGQHVLGFCVMTFSTAAATASFAMLLATLCKSRAQLNAVSVVIILSMSAVGGSMIPRFAMSDRMKEFGKWTFNAWALDGYQKVFWYQSPVSSLKTEVTVLLGSALVLGLLTLILSRRWKRG